MRGKEGEAGVRPASSIIPLFSFGRPPSSSGMANRALVALSASAVLAISVVSLKESDDPALDNLTDAALAWAGAMAVTTAAVRRTVARAQRKTLAALALAVGAVVVISAAVDGPVLLPVPIAVP